MVVGLYLGEVKEDTLVFLEVGIPQDDGESVTSCDGDGGVTKGGLTGMERVFTTALLRSFFRSIVKCMYSLPHKPVSRLIYTKQATH